MTDLKPCPFCGSSDVATQHCDEVSNVCCDNCHAGYWTSDGKDAESIWNNRVSHWRSLKDYRAPDDSDAMILLRRTERLAWMLCGPLGRRRTIELAMADGFDEYMEVPS